MRAGRVELGIVATLMSAAILSAQTTVTPPKNKYAVKDDVKLGREAAAEVDKQMPLLRDDAVTSYIEDMGRRLASGVPARLQHPEFQYTFKVINVREINAFALPGGPMYVNRGMIAAAKTEGEVAGVVAHEISHVALRHGTAGATKQTPYAIGGIAGAILGAVIGGRKGEVVSQASQTAAGVLYLRFPREYEKQADLLGAQIMARVGYDPRDMANMFKTIEEQGGPGGPQWLSDHPNPGNRYAYINEEAQALRVENPVRDDRGFRNVQARLGSMPPAPTTEEATKNAGTGGGPRPAEGRAPAGRVAAPSSRFTTYSESNLFRVAVPSNWREIRAKSSVTFAPEGGYGAVNQQSVFTHGVEAGIARDETHDLQTATEELIQSLAGSNPRLRQSSDFTRTTVGGQAALRATLGNVSDATGHDERIALYTAQLRDGTLFYLIGVAPAAEYGAYEPVFRKVAASVEFVR